MILRLSVAIVLSIVGSVAAQESPLASAKPVPRMQAIPLPHHITSFQLDGRELTVLDHAARRIPVAGATAELAGRLAALHPSQVSPR